MTSLVLSQDSNTITVQICKSRWKRLIRLEESYRVARRISKATKQVADAPAMNSTEAINLLRSL